MEIAKSRLKQLSDDNFDLLYETFVLKEKAHDVAQVCLSESMAQLHQVYMGAMKETPRLGFRSVSFGEIRRLDTVISKDIFKYLSRGEGSYDDGLNFYLHGDGKSNVIWKLLESQFEDAPDRGVVGPLAVLRVAAAASPPGHSKRAHSEFVNSPRESAAKRRATPKPGKPASSMPGPSIGAKRTFHEMDPDNTPEGFAAKRRAIPKPASRPPNGCSECWHPRDLHYKRVFCDRRVEQGNAKVAKAKGAGKATRKGVTNVPNFKLDKAVLEVTQEHPQGRKYCFNFHDPNASCNKPSWDKPNKCELSHRCPVYKISGEVCNMAHAQYDHKREVHG